MLEIPDDLFTIITKGAFPDKKQIVRNVKEINNFHHEELYIAIGYHDHYMELIGCPDLESLPALAEYCETFRITDIVSIVHAIPLNPESLPCETTHTSVIILLNDFSIGICNNLMDAANSVEILINKWPKTFIEDFAVLVGEEVDFNPKDYGNRSVWVGM